MEPFSLIGQSLGDYEVLDEIGVGGMGVVYRARHRRLERFVALKRLPLEQVDDPRRRQRFLQEARAASALNHPGIVTIHDVIRHGEDDVIVMELVEGESLDRLITVDGLPWRRAASLGLALSQAMTAAHAAGIVHRDLKPSNIMVTTGTDPGRLKVLDFGIAKRLPQASFDDASPVEPTERGASPGTPAYMAPEQLLGETVDHRTDIFSFGMVLYEMLTGQRPFRGLTSAAQVDQVLHGDPPSLRDLKPEIPVALDALVLQTLAKQPNYRAQDMGEVSQTLEEICRPQQGPSAPESTLGTSLKTLVALDWCEATVIEENPDGNTPPDDLPHLVQQLASRHGALPHDKPPGDIWLFELPWQGVCFAMDFHRRIAQLQETRGQRIEHRVGLHLGEVTVLPKELGRSDRASSETVDTPDSPGQTSGQCMEIDGLALRTCRRLRVLASRGQTLLTHAVFDLARRGAARQDARSGNLQWLAHGGYVFVSDEKRQRISLDGEPLDGEPLDGEPLDGEPLNGEPLNGEPLDIFEVGIEGLAPLRPPSSTSSAQRAPSRGLILGWRPAPGLSVPQRPNWKIERKLGVGGAGEVWLARQAKTQQPRVFKFCYEAEHLRSLQREITVFRLLKEELGERHDIARLIDWNLETAPYFLESAYTEGGSLVDWAENQGGLHTLPLDARIELVAQVATALEAAHSVGVLHKDVKPANVLIRQAPDEPPHAVLTDFGIGRILDPQRLKDRDITVLGLSLDTQLADSSSFSGTRLYMAPELLTGRPPSIQSDLYAFGVMLYQVVVGDLQRPLAAGWERDVPDALLRQDIAECVDGQPQTRPRSAADIAERLRHLEPRRQAAASQERALREAAEAERSAEQEARRAQRRRRFWRFTATASTVVLLVVSLLAWQAMGARAEAERQRAQAEQLVDLLLGDLHESLEKIGRLDLLEQAARGSQEYFDATHTSDDGQVKRGLTLINMGDVLIKQGDIDAARSAYADAETLFATEITRQTSTVAMRDGLRRSQLKLALVQSRQGDIQGAIQRSQVTLTETSLWAEAAERPTRWRYAMAETHYWLCNFEDRGGDRTAALDSCRAALSYLQPSESPQAGLTQAGLTQTGSTEDIPWRHQLLLLNSRILLGGIHRVLEQGDAAFSELDAARTLAQRLVDEDPANTSWSQKLAWIHFQTAVLHLFHRRDPDAAFDGLMAARREYQQLIAIDPLRTRWRDNLAETLNLIGRIELQRQDAAAALLLFSQAAEILEGLMADHPSQVQRFGTLARIRQSMGRAHTDMGSFELAVTSFADAVDLNRRVVEVSGETPDPVNFLSWSHVVLGDGYARQGDLKKARREWQRAVDLIAPITATSQSIQYRDTHAQALLKLGEIETARPIVTTLLAEGWNDAEFLRLVQQAGLDTSNE